MLLASLKMPGIKTAFRWMLEKSSRVWRIVLSIKNKGSQRYDEQTTAAADAPKDDPCGSVSDSKPFIKMIGIHAREAMRFSVTA
jgi:hypothetical protein